jgi:N-acetylglucosamine-6-phosphate deacetylase
MTANSPVLPEGSILTPNGWVTGKVEFAGHTISAVDGRMTAAGKKPKGPFVLPGFIDLHVHGGGGGDWQGGEEGVRTFVRYHTSCGTTVIAPTTAIGPVSVIEKSLSAITSITAVRLPGEAVVLGAHLEGPFINPVKPGAMAASLTLEGDAALARSWAEKFKIVIATVAPEIAGGLDVTKALAERGCRVQIGHSIATMLDAFRNLISLGLSLEQAAEMTSARQAEYLGLQDVGRIEPGARACLVKLDEDFGLQGVWVDGESIAPTS